MNDNDFNDLMPDGGALSEAQQRADKINAIKNSVRSSYVSDETAVNNVTEPVINPVEISAADSAEVSSDDEWENEIADRIAKRVQQMKDKKSSEVRSSDKLIEEIDRILEEQDSETADNNSVINEDPQEEKSVQPAEDDSYQVPDEEQAEAHQEEPDTPAVEQRDEKPHIEDIVSEEIKPAKKKKSKNKKSKKKKKTVGQCLLGLFPNKKDTIGERIRKIIFLGSIAAIIVCGYIVSDYYIGNYLTSNRYENLMSMYSTYSTDNSNNINTTDDDGPIYSLLPGAQKLLDINEDVVGVINIPGTEVNYPIVQSDGLEKYLHLDVTGKEAKAGSIFLDYRCSFDNVGEDGRLVQPNTDNLIVYGHNMANRMMFGSLRDYKEYDYYYGEHPVIELNSNYQTYTYKIFAFFIVDANDDTDTAFDCWNNINFIGEEDFYNFVNEAKRRTLRTNDVDVEYGDKLLTLSTCNSIFGNGGRGRLIVLARQVREGEDPYEGTQNSAANPNIKWPNLYYSYSGSSKRYDSDAEFVPYGSSAETSGGSEE